MKLDAGRDGVKVGDRRHWRPPPPLESVRVLFRSPDQGASDSRHWNQTACYSGVRTKEMLDTADIGKLRPRWDGPFTVTACQSPNAYTVALPRKMRCSPTVNVDRLKPFFERADEPPTPSPISDAGRRASTSWTCCSTARWCGGLPSTLSAGDTSRPSHADAWRSGRVEELNNSRNQVAEYDAIALKRCAARSAARRAVLVARARGPRPGPAPPSADHQAGGA